MFVRNFLKKNVENPVAGEVGVLLDVIGIAMVAFPQHFMCRVKIPKEREENPQNLQTLGTSVSL